MPRDDDRPRSGRREALPPWAWAVIAVGVAMVVVAVVYVAAGGPRKEAASVNGVSNNQLEQELVKTWAISSKRRIIAAHEVVWLDGANRVPELIGDVVYTAPAAERNRLHAEYLAEVSRLELAYRDSYRVLHELNPSRADSLTEADNVATFRVKQAALSRLAVAIVAAHLAFESLPPGTDEQTRKVAARKVFLNHAEQCYRETLKVAEATAAR